MATYGGGVENGEKNIRVYYLETDLELNASFILASANVSKILSRIQIAYCKINHYQILR